MYAPVNPLEGPPPAEVPLSRSPLVRVIAQVRFPLIASVEKPEFMGAFQEAIRADYPVLRPERVLRLHPEALPATIWRFSGTDSDWKVTLAGDFLALETERYTSRSDFLSRLSRALFALEQHVNPRVMDRLGVRYIDRVIGADFLDISSLVRPEVSGVLSTPLAGFAQISLSEHLFRLPEEEGMVTARWGLLPANASVDPSAVEPIAEASWLLDLDAYHAGTRALDVEATVAQARALSERIYALFRWAVRDDFLRRHGGQL